MKKTWMPTLALLAAFCFIHSASAVPILPPPPPTTEQLKKMLDAGQYKDALDWASKILFLRGPAADGYDRPEILLLRAEAEIQLHAGYFVQAGLQQILKEDPEAHNKDRHFQALALIELLNHAPNGLYRPTPSAKPLDIRNHPSRMIAYQLIFDAEIAPFESKLDPTLQSTSLIPVIKLGQQGAALQALEHILTGQGKRTDKEMDQLGTYAVALMDTQLIKDEKTAATIITDAETQVTDYSVDSDGYTTADTHPNGYTTQDRLDMQNIRDLTKRIWSTAQDLRTTFPTQSPDFRRLVINANVVYRRAYGLKGGNLH